MNPPFSTNQLPLPQGWSEHVGPHGQPYYHNSLTGESTYVPPVHTAQTYPVKIKEKPLLKTHIPGTDWFRVTTTTGNIFYFHKLSKKSVWTAPDELKAALELLQASESEVVKPTGDKKRKAEEPADIGQTGAKKARIDDELSESDMESEDSAIEEEWQYNAAKQLALEAEELRKRKEDERREKEELEAQRAFAANEIVMPRAVDLSIEEGKALFKALLGEKNINPLHPWDTSLPKFISDPRYVLLPSVNVRREAFDEYCKERARELRQSVSKKVQNVSEPNEEFEHLLKEEVKSTRTNWTDFRKAWKKDRRFYGWGRDDREREKRFKDFLKQLSKSKKEALRQAETDFLNLLKETKNITMEIPWKEVKKGIYKDPRYDAVGSSSLREELFNTYTKGLVSSGKELNQISLTIGSDTANEGDLQEDRRLRAMRQREEKVKAERQTLNSHIEQSKIGIDMEDGESSFMSLLTDAIRDPQIKWEQALSQLKSDPRCTNSPVPLNRQVHLFHNHVAKLRSKQLTNLHVLFEANTPSLATQFSMLPLHSILYSLPVVKLGFDADRLEDEFRSWQREKRTTARKAFDEMLSENSFVDFWGRLGKMGENVLESYVKVADDDIGEVDDEKVDMKALARHINISEMEKVLKNDKRYNIFDHIPEQREQWIRNYLALLSAPKRSVHLPG